MSGGYALFQNFHWLVYFDETCMLSLKTNSKTKRTSVESKRIHLPFGLLRYSAWAVDCNGRKQWKNQHKNERRNALVIGFMLSLFLFRKLLLFAHDFFTFFHCVDVAWRLVSAHFTFNLPSSWIPGMDYRSPRTMVREESQTHATRAAVQLSRFRPMLLLLRGQKAASTIKLKGPDCKGNFPNISWRAGSLTLKYTLSDKRNQGKTQQPRYQHYHIYIYINIYSGTCSVYQSATNSLCLDMSIDGAFFTRIDPR